MDSAYIQSWLPPSYYNFLLFLSMALLLAYYFVIITYRLFFSPLRSIPGPWYAAVSDFWLTTHVLRLRRCRAVDDLFKQYGPIVRAGPNKVFFLDAVAMKSVYGASSKFSKSSWYKCLLANENDHAMTTLDHAHHATRKRGYAPHYTPSNLALFQSEMHDYTLELLQSLTALSAQTRLPHDTLTLFRHLMIDVNCAHLFGHRVGSLGQWASHVEGHSDLLSTAINDFPKRGLIRGALPTWLWNVVTRIPISRWRQLCNSDQILAEFVSERVYETRARLQSGKIGLETAEKVTFIERLLQHRYAPSNELMPDADIVSEGMGHMIAGSDTTSTTLSYIFWELSRRPDISAKLQAELDQCMSDSHDLPDIQVLQSLPYLNAIIKEVLRVYGAAPSPLERVVSGPRSCVPFAPFTLLGHMLPAGTVVATQAWSSHRQPTVFPSPNFFNPDRWLVDPVAHNSTSALASYPSTTVEKPNTASKNILADMNAQMMPFGVGTRICGGQNLAQMMLRITVAAIARNFDVIAPAETNEASMDMRDSFVIFPAAMECKLMFVPRK